MKNVMMLASLCILFGCGQAKTIYADQKYDLKYSKYDSTKRSQCISECSKKKYEDAKSD